MWGSKSFRLGIQQGLCFHTWVQSSPVCERAEQSAEAWQRGQAMHFRILGPSRRNEWVSIHLRIWAQRKMQKQGDSGKLGAFTAASESRIWGSPMTLQTPSCPMRVCS